MNVDMMQALQLLLQGMVGIFVVLGIIAVIVKVMGAIGSRAAKKKQ